MSNTRRRSIHVIAQTADITRPNACAALRLVDPFSHPMISNTFDISFGSAAPAEPVDLLVMQRMGLDAENDFNVENLVRSAKCAGTRLVYDIDDNLLDTHPDFQSEREIAVKRRTVRFLLQNADHVTVSTAPLRDRVSKLNAKVSIVPNALDERKLSKTLPIKAENDGLKIGYFGTFTHLRDLMTVVGPLRAALPKLSRKVTLVLCGVSNDTRMLSLFRDFVSVETLPATGDYCSFMEMMLQKANWDIGLAPLAAGQFESTKSDIKFLEYAALGIPGIYSNHVAYADVQHGASGMVAAPEEWAENLLSLAKSSELRTQIVSASREYLFSQRTLAATSSSLLRILEKVLEGKR